MSAASARAAVAARARAGGDDRGTRRIALLFPGQGSQSAGMGRSVADSFPESRAVFDEADTALGETLSRLCFEGPDETLALTTNTQPAVLTVSVAVLRALEARGVRAEASAGHSLGEYSAHVAAGTIGFADAARAVRARGEFMQEAVPVGEGAMAAVIGLDDEQIRALCAAAAAEGVVEPANFNSPEQIVIAGASAAVDRAIADAEAAGAGKAVRLPVSAPFHSSLMRPAAERLATVLEAIAFSDPRMPVYSNVDAMPVGQATAARDALVRQVASPVLWYPLVRRMIDDGFDTFVEVGPGRVLTGLMRRIDRGVRMLVASDADGVERVAEQLGGGS